MGSSCGKKTVLFVRLKFSDGKEPNHCPQSTVADIMWTKGGSNGANANSLFRHSSCKFSYTQITDHR